MRATAGGKGAASDWKKACRCLLILTQLPGAGQTRQKKKVGSSSGGPVWASQAQLGSAQLSLLRLWLGFFSAFGHAQAQLVPPPRLASPNSPKRPRPRANLGRRAGVRLYLLAAPASLAPNSLWLPFGWPRVLLLQPWLAVARPLARSAGRPRPRRPLSAGSPKLLRAATFARELQQTARFRRS